VSRIFKRIGILIPTILLAFCVCAYSAGSGVPHTRLYAPAGGTDVELSSVRYARPETDTAPAVSPVTLDGYEMMLENGVLSLWFHRQTASLRIADGRSGYVWGCVDTVQPKGLNKSWYSFASSLLSIEYYDEKDTEKRAGMMDKDTECSYEWHSDGLTAQVAFSDLGISMTVRVRLEGNRVRVSVDPDSFQENGNAKIKSVYMLPFLGAVRENALPGYMFIPDGPGALIRYAPSVNYTSTYNKRIYGLDMGIDALSVPSGLQASRGDDYLVEEPRITLPVFGVVHGAYQNAFYGEVTGGTEYASIQAYAAGMITDFNWVTARFDMRQGYVKPINRAGTGIYMPQEERNTVSPEVCYTFLTGEDADYSGMAVSYREDLLQRGVLGARQTKDTEVPLCLSVVGSEVRDGFWWDTTQTLTTFKQAAGMAEDLAAEGVRRLTMVYQGWQSGGLSRYKLGKTSIQGTLGNLRELRALRDMTEKTGSFYLQENIVAGNDPQVSRRGQAAVNRSKAYVHFTRNDPTLMYKDRWLVKPAVSSHLLRQTVRALPDFSRLLPEYGEFLYSDYTRNGETTRSGALRLQIDTISGAQTPVALTNPNMYLWPYTGVIFQVPITSGQYLYTTDTVPFLPIVISGFFEAYAPYINQGLYAQNAILRLVEYGLYPSFIAMGADNQALADTPLIDLFSIHYADWRDRIISAYNTVSDPLGRIRGQSIINHRILEEGLARIQYSDGVTIYVNYNARECHADGLIIPAGGVAVK
jgi:hypothetical protein